MNKALWKPWPRLCVPWAMGVALSLLGTGSPWAATGAVTLTEATLAAGKLSVRGTAPKGAPVELYDLNGRRLWTGRKANFAVTLTPAELASVPCSVRAESAGSEAVLPVAGAPADCRKAPSCKILAPVAGTGFKVGQPAAFKAQVTGGKSAWPITYQWDWAGGAMGHPSGTLNKAAPVKAQAAFLLDDSVHRVRFIATDAEGRRCEDAVEVAVGHPPAGLPSKVKEQPAASFGAELAGQADDVAVLPYEEWTFQNRSDMRFSGNGYSSFSPTIHNMRAYAFKKDRLPVFLGDDAVELRYSAASNPADPVGTGSVNSTSRNWPSTADFADATVKKGDLWEIATRAAEQKSPTYFACSWQMTGYWGAFGCGAAQGLPTPDEGYFKAKKDEAGNIVPDDPNNAAHGLFMPGRDNPYQANAPQPFSMFVPTQVSQAPGVADQPAGWFAANLLPITDVDDQGRVNPYPLLRVQAVDKASGKVVAKTDGTLSVSRDFHCRECHTKGEVGANPKAARTKEAFGSSAFGQVALREGLAGGPTHRYYLPEERRPSQPELFSVADIGGDPNNILDQEYAASLNYSSMHQFYDVYPFLYEVRYGVARIGLSDEEKASLTGLVKSDTPRPCYGCHFTPINSAPFGKTHWSDEEGWDVKDPAYAPNYSISMHRFHAELQWKDDAHTDIVRDEKGAFVRWDWKGQGQHNSTKTRSLFPIFDGQGNQLPMDENCMKCHNGHREQLYRDRMYTAGVTCYDCHGDMLAVGQAFPKNYLANQDKLGSFERDDYRLPWYDEPDCGSCHVGDANQGKDKANGFFSAGVMKTAFDAADFSATTRPIDRTDVNATRFSAAPLENYKAVIPTTYYYDYTLADRFLKQEVDTKIDAPVFRLGKDRHGNVACAACHGAAHAVWPNADPSANDNVTALQLQGHTGTLHECNVCHTADAFRLQGDLDGGTYSGDAKAGLLGGPHNLHPVNDAYWWKAAVGDVSNQDGTKYGGWHNNYAKKPGQAGEDQCAACHGADHKGTRLSKTPVDRVFDFSDLDFAKLQAAGFKAKVVKVAAGTEIGCDTCHSIETSCTGSPAGSQCGVGTATQASAQ
jgi:hypothetical protein